MNPERVLTVLRCPITSEKTTRLAEKPQKQMTFKVQMTATKSEIKAAVEAAFKVKVQSVSVLTVKGKAKKFKQTIGRRSDWKKAYVSLAPKEDIQFVSAE